MKPWMNCVANVSGLDVIFFNLKRQPKMSSRRGRAIASTDEVCANKMNNYSIILIELSYTVSSALNKPDPNDQFGLLSSTEKSNQIGKGGWSLSKIEYSNLQSRYGKTLYGYSCSLGCYSLKASSADTNNRPQTVTSFYCTSLSRDISLGTLRAGDTDLPHQVSPSLFCPQLLLTEPSAIFILTQHVTPYTWTTESGLDTNIDGTSTNLDVWSVSSYLSVLVIWLPSPSNFGPAVRNNPQSATVTLFLS